ncbi:MAG TPA: hypothetical protein VFD64_12560 [Gemmatimonadaceae bacterium]|nr:hypothetical protein [Gemmatimonadaceae bacterium]
MRSKAWFVSTMMLGSGLLAGCNLSQENPTSPAVALPDGSVALTSRDAPASGTKVAMCHRREDATYHRLDVPSPAAPAHRAHGDAAVGEAVPGAVLLVFNEACAPAPKTFVITTGIWLVDMMFVSQFDIGGQELSAKGRWQEPSRVGVCGGVCTVGQTITVDILYESTPDAQFPAATGWAAIANTSYPSPDQFGGPLRFVTQSFTFPAPEPGTYAVEIQIPFTLTGQLKGYLVAGRRDPLLAFDVPVSGHGTATVLFVGGVFWSIRFDFEE